MKKNKSKKNIKLPKYDFGGMAQAIPGLFNLISELSNNNSFETSSIRQSSNNGISLESPEEALMKNDIAKVKADRTASNNGWVKGLEIGGGMAQQLGSMLMSYGSSASSTETLGGKTASTTGSAGFMNKNFGKMATGGKVGIPTPIEAEGEEVIETPNGDVSQLKGPSHSEGGIDMVVPSGSEIFSKKLKGADGKSMAQRKIDREKKEAKVEKLLKDSPTDMTLKKTLQRTKANNEKVEQTDMMKMQFAKMMADMVQHYALGGVVKYDGGGYVFPWDEEPENELINKYNKKPKLATPNYVNTNPNIDYGAVDKFFGNLPISDDAHVSEVTNRPYSATPVIVADGSSNKNSGVSGDASGDEAGKYDWLNNIIGGKNGGMTAGDMVGLFGQLYSTFKPMENTRANRAGDTPNINPFLNYGKDALAKMDQSKEYIKQIRDEQNKDLELSRTSAIKRGRNSARGVNTLRALDLAADANANNTKSQIFNQFAQAMQTIYGQEATLENDQDAKVMQGEYMRDLADRQDRDNYFTQMAQDIATKGAGLQHIGKSFNQIKSRNVTNNVLDSLFPDFDMSGMDGKMRRKLTKTASSNAEFLKSIPDTNVRQTVLTKVDSGEWYIKNNKVYDKSSNEEINLTKN